MERFCYRGQNIITLYLFITLITNDTLIGCSEYSPEYSVANTSLSLFNFCTNFINFANQVIYKLTT